MAINERLIHTAADAAAAVASAEQGLILHLDANDVDSYDGDGSIWYDISEHDVTIPLSDNADDLELHLNASDSTSYGGSGTTWTDISGNDRDGTINGAPPYAIDRYGSFDFTQSTGDYISLTTNSALQPASGGTSYEFWITPDTSSDTNTLLYYGTSDGYGFWLWNNYGTPYFTAYNSSNSTVASFTSGHSISNNTLAHVVFTLSSDINPVVKIYVDGEFKATATGSGTIRKDSAVNILLGRYTTGNPNDYDGKMHACRVYSKELSASDVGQNYRHGIDYIYTELNGNSDLFLHYDPADTNSYSGTGTTLTDLAGNNNADLLGGIESGWDEELGNSFPMTGSGDGITTSSTVSINPATDGMTIEMWVKVKTDDFSYFFSFDGTNTTGFGLSYRANYDEIWWFYRNSSNNNSIIHSDTIVLNEWTHIVATTNGSSAQFYTNGVLSEETSDNAYSYSYNEDLHFGNLYDLAQNSNSDIGQIRFYKGGLTADEVMQNYLFTKNDYPNGFNGTNSGLSFNPSGYFTYDSTSDKSVITNGKQKGILPNSSTDTTTLIWARIHSTSALSYILTGRSSSIRNFYFRHYLNNLTLAIYNDSQSRDINENFGSLSANTWYLLGFRTTTDGNVRVNVITTGTSTFTDATATMSSYESTDVDFNIGFYQTGNGFDGDIGAVKVYNKYLSDSEITAYFDATKDDYGL